MSILIFATGDPIRGLPVEQLSSPSSAKFMGMKNESMALHIYLKLTKALHARILKHIPTPSHHLRRGLLAAVLVAGSQAAAAGENEKLLVQPWWNSHELRTLVRTKYTGYFSEKLWNTQNGILIWLIGTDEWITNVNISLDPWPWAIFCFLLKILYRSKPSFFGVQNTPNQPLQTFFETYFVEILKHSYPCHAHLESFNKFPGIPGILLFTWHFLAGLTRHCYRVLRWTLGLAWLV